MGGSQATTLLLAEHLGEFGYAPVLICPEAGAFVDAARRRGVEVLICEPGPAWRTYGKAAEGLGRWLSRSHLTQLLRYWFQLRDVLRRGRIQLLHCNDVRAVVMAAAAARLARIPSLWHLHSAPGRGQRRWLDALLALCTDRAVFVSAAMRDAWTLPEWMLGAHETIPNGIQRVAPASPLPHPGVPLIVSVGTLHPRKGFDVLIRALPELKRRVPRLHLWIVGKDWGDGAHERELRTLVSELALDDCVQFLGQREDVASIMATADVVVIPSISEPFGMVALEAMLQSRPVVASRTGGLTSIICDGQTGLLTRSGDPDGLAHAIARLLGDRQLALAMGSAGLRRARDDFSAAKMAQRFAAAYAAMLSTDRSGSAPTASNAASQAATSVCDAPMARKIEEPGSHGSTSRVPSH